MLKRDDFVNFILEGPKEKKAEKDADDQGPSLPDGFGDFGFSPEETQEETEAEFSFARQLMEASGFGNAEYLERSEVILGNDPAAKFLPQRVYYWPKKDKRPYQTLLFELEQPGRQLLKAAIFKKLKSQEILEDAVSRLVQMSLRGFEKGGEKRTASVKSGKQNETLCIVSIQDDRLESDKPLHLVCLGTKSKKLDSLENYHIREEARLWERQLAVDHLSRLYDRHFSKLDGEKWQESFITGEERKLAQKLMDACVKKQPQKRSIEKCVVGLLEEIAKTFGLRKKKGGSRLMPFELPKDHDIGVDPEKREKGGGQNPFEGMILRDEKSRLLGYIIYCLDQKKDASKLRKYLERNNRFHNVLVIYPDGTEAVLELWQGMKRLEGKLTKQGAAFEGEGKIVNLLSRFFVVSKAKVRNPEELAEELAYRARYLRRLALKQLQEEKNSGLLRDLYNAFKEALIHDQTEDQFADSYAQTLTYGLLSARWISKDNFASRGERFTREKAIEHFPPSSPFLHDFFKTVLKVHSEFKLSWLLDDIADLLDRTDISRVFGAESGDAEGQISDPVIHFYEPFLSAYDKKIKSKRGVFFTPRPIVSYIVRTVHELLQTEFGLDDGLASTDTWADVTKRFKELKIPEGVKTSDPFVCILDPATGTGTFLFECIDIIEKTVKNRLCRELKTTDLNDPILLARWNEYIPKYLLPRLYGYEVMIASYAIAHLKLSFKLGESGYKMNKSDRIRNYLTNSLEPPSSMGQQKIPGMFSALAYESQVVDEIKSKKFFTVVIGNPPYSKLSLNWNKWIDALLHGTGDHKVSPANYYMVDGAPLGETTVWIQDDYIKFMRLSQWHIDRSHCGVHAFISNNGYLDNPTLRGMRQQLKESFARIYALDLHGSTKRGEQSPDGSPDKNVFDIQQGVAIGVFAKIPWEKPRAVYHAELWGERKVKYNMLNRCGLSDISWVALDASSPFHLFVPMDSSHQNEYESGWKVTDIFPQYHSGIITKRDSLSIHWTQTEVIKTVKDFVSLAPETARKKYKLPADVRDWKVSWAQDDLRKTGLSKKRVIPILYRPFDVRYTYFTGRSRGFIGWPVADMTRLLLSPDNLALVTTRMTKGEKFQHALVTKHMPEVICLSAKTSNNGFAFPLYSSFLEKKGPMFQENESTLPPASANFSASFIEEFSVVVGLKYIQIGSGDLQNTFGPEDVFRYIISLLYSRMYRERYWEFLSRDFPRILLPGTFDIFGKLAKIGSQLISLQLMESSKLDNLVTTYNGPENPNVNKVGWADDHVWIDAAKVNAREGNRAEKPGKISIYGISEEIWDFHIGGYQVCHKWFKYRKGRILSKDDLIKYQEIVVAIKEIIHSMRQIDNSIEEHGGYPDAFITNNGDN